MPSDDDSCLAQREAELMRRGFIGPRPANSGCLARDVDTALERRARLMEDPTYASLSRGAQIKRSAQAAKDGEAARQNAIRAYAGIQLRTYTG